jgi:glycosyltransferase involved in cell wall biosynthesis
LSIGLKRGASVVRWCFFSPGYLSFRVLCGDSSRSGGAEAQVAYLAAELTRLGHEVGLIYGHGKKTSDPQTVAGVVCIDASPLWQHPGSLASFWRAMAFLSPHVLYARLPSDFLWLMGAFARSNPQTHFIYALAHDLHARAWSAYDHRRWFHAPLYHLGLRSADAIAIQHEQQATLLSPHLRHRLVYVPNLVRPSGSSRRDYGASKFHAIWVAKIRPEKRLDLFLDLAASLPDMDFAVVGGFDPTVSSVVRARLEERAAGLSNVAYLGPRRAPDVLAALRESRVLVSTSESEGFPNSMLEAWSVGVPVVSLSIDPGGVIEREGIGLVARSATRLRQQVQLLTRNRTLNEDLGGRGLAYVGQQHGADRVIGALMRAAGCAERPPVLEEVVRTAGSTRC